MLEYNMNALEADESAFIYGTIFAAQATNSMLYSPSSCFFLPHEDHVALRQHSHIRNPLSRLASYGRGQLSEFELSLLRPTRGPSL